MLALRILAAVAIATLVLRASSALDAQGASLGGFVESATSTTIRPAFSAAQAQAFLPPRGGFTFPPPYNTAAVRLTNASDCAGNDCVLPVGYSYWNNINNHLGSDTMLVFLGLDRNKGGTGPTLFSIHKPTGATANLGPIFPAGSPYSSLTGEGWYFSRNRPHTLYLNHGPRLFRYDVQLRALETVFDVTGPHGANRYISQIHSSNDDRVHSATLHVIPSDEKLGCIVYRETPPRWWFFARQGELDECQIDKSGRWLVIKENVDGRNGEDNRVIDLDLGIEVVLLDEWGAGGHSDIGYGYMAAEDNFNAKPGAVRLWRFDLGAVPGQGSLVYHLASWSSGLGHIAHGNARPGALPGQQVACASNASRQALPRVNEIVCFRLDQSLNALVVAPNLSDLNAAGGGADDYGKLPKGNLDLTGEYFVWTANAGTARLDAFVVRVPIGRLSDGALAPSAPAHLLAMVNGSQLALSWTNTTGGGPPAGMVLNVTGSAHASFALPPGEMFSVDGVPPGTYTLTMSAFNGHGVSAPSNAVTVTVPAACSGAPDAPRDLQASTSGNQVTVAWLPPAAGPAATIYGLLVSGSWSGAIPVTSRALTGTVGPGTYTISVVAANPCGVGAATAPRVVTIP